MDFQFFLFWKNGKFLFPFSESRLSQWLRQGCTIGKARNFETWLREYYSQSKKWLHYHKNVPDVWYFRGEEKKKSRKNAVKIDTSSYNWFLVNKKFVQFKVDQELDYMKKFFYRSEWVQLVNICYFFSISN